MTHKEFIKHVTYCDYNKIKIGLSDPNVDLTYNEYHAFLTAVKYNNAKSVKLFLKCKRFDPTPISCRIIKIIGSYAYYDLLKIIIKDNRFDISCDNDLLLRSIARRGCIKCVKLLLKDNRVNINSTSETNNKNFALINAIKARQLDTALILLDYKQINPNLTDNEALKYSIYYGFTEIVEKILKISNVDLLEIVDKKTLLKCILYKYYSVLNILFNDENILKIALDMDNSYIERIDHILSKKLNIPVSDFNTVRTIL